MTWTEETDKLRKKEENYKSKLITTGVKTLRPAKRKCKWWWHRWQTWTAQDKKSQRLQLPRSLLSTSKMIRPASHSGWKNGKPMSFRTGSTQLLMKQKEMKEFFVTWHKLFQCALSSGWNTGRWLKQKEPNLRKLSSTLKHTLRNLRILLSVWLSWSQWRDSKMKQRTTS